jgi:Sir2- and TIR-associating SLOG family/SIR2-like domain
MKRPDPRAALPTRRPNIRRNAGAAGGVNDREAFITAYLKELRANNAAVFVGAGMSRGAGYVDWVGLLSPVAAELGLDVGKETDLAGVAQFHVNANANNRHHLNQLLVNEFSDLHDPTENHALLARLPIGIYWTTNYDRLIERALEASGKRTDAKYTVKQLATTRRGRDAVIYKMHGDIEHPADAILTKDDYERYHRTHGPFISALAGDLVEHTFLFVGFSFTDPNLDYVLGRIRATFEENQRHHFCLMKKRVRLAGENGKDHQYAINKQALVTQDLMRFNIKTLFVSDYPEITAILQTIVSRFRRRTVFISGSAADYGQWGRVATEDFLVRLGAALIAEDYRIASGFGLGIGGAIVTGATQQIYSSKARSVDEQLILRPFPIGIADPDERERTFQRYREELLAQAGIAIFVLGNKDASGVVVDAEGMLEEFDLARRLGLHVVPIGASGFVSQKLWNQVTADFGTFFPAAPRGARGLFRRIGKPTARPEDLLDPIIELVSLLSKE